MLYLSASQPCYVNKMVVQVILWSKISNSGSLKDQFTAEVLSLDITEYFKNNLHSAIFYFVLDLTVCLYYQQLLLRMNSAFYVADSLVASSREEADRLMIIVSGSVRSAFTRLSVMSFFLIGAHLEEL